jgi:hypothetical protein
MTSTREYTPGIPITTQFLALAQRIISQESPAVENNGLGDITWTLPGTISPVALRLEADVRTKEYDSRSMQPREVGRARFMKLETDESIEVRRDMPAQALSNDELAEEMLKLFTWSLSHPHHMCLRAVERSRLARQRERNPFNPFPTESVKVVDRRRVSG